MDNIISERPNLSNRYDGLRINTEQNNNVDGSISQQKA